MCHACLLHELQLHCYYGFLSLGHKFDLMRFKNSFATSLRYSMPWSSEVVAGLELPDLLITSAGDPLFFLLEHTYIAGDTLGRAAVLEGVDDEEAAVAGAVDAQAWDALKCGGCGWFSCLERRHLRHIDAVSMVAEVLYADVTLSRASLAGGSYALCL